jgi:predicted MFS family arabinose efflux permease
LVFGAAKAETDGWGSTITITCLIGGVVLLALFTQVERRSSYPLIPLRVILNRNRGGSYLAAFLGNAGTFSAFLFLTYYFQDVLHYSPVKTGLAFIPLPLAIGAAATLVQSKILPHFTTRTIILTGLTVSAAGAGLLTRAGVQSDYAAWVLPGLILMGAGIGSALVVALAMGSAADSPEEAGSAGSMNNVSQQIGAAMGVAFVSTIVATATANYLNSHVRFAGKTVVAHASVHGFSVGYACAAGIYLAAAIISSRVVMGKNILSSANAIEAVEEVIPVI